MGRFRKSQGITELIEEDLKDPTIRTDVEKKLAQIRIEQMIAQLRTTAGLSQSQLARRIGKSQPWIAEAEKRTAANMQLSTLATLVTATGGSFEITVRDRRGKKVGKVEVGRGRAQLRADGKRLSA